MRYSLDENLSDLGFRFYEKLHEPIFLVSRWGKILRLNEAGRKFLQVAHLATPNLEEKIHLQFKSSLEAPKAANFLRFSLEKTNLQLIARFFENGDCFLVELKRRQEKKSYEFLSPKERWLSKISIVE